MDGDVLLFFAGKPEALAIYAALLELLEPLGEFTVKAHKTQLSLKNRRVFACVSFLRPLRKARMPERFLTLTLGLPCPPGSPRAAASVEVRPGRWTHHIVLAGPEELDGELRSLLREAWDFGNRPR